MTDLFHELFEVASALEEAGVTALVVGGLAYSIYVEPRATEDLDFLIAPEDWPRCVEALGSKGWRDVSGEMDFRQIRMRRLTKFVGEEAVVCDFLLADGELLDELKRAQRLLWQGHPLLLAHPETIIELKRRRSSQKDRGDIEGLERFLRGE
jgi:hypothetical protein